ncbi:hypothetical protein Pmar_PMAR016117 [Perkinsus marinus ATCC 50983]|uniref:Uncharacterized protein n=1 Tax=Perkinsus marinus (strain ATCC 50983 / TXsc) TaxID=423536 RepID=C5LZ30_PERM5|nr:hypothetical protein Pmar_PMAR016117 [Perkinsus marinus ATCC 50983]EEQ98039.1 hypothetical protein Pmar_PMAR016117 [Perkinsus marinus ATCC 50983]|eukprot:XP_002765322.1 hypothetical protein Pmar_PMAR016117 [Perkinsus marinus ATCC 50983]
MTIVVVRMRLDYHPRKNLGRAYYDPSSSDKKGLENTPLAPVENGVVVVAHHRGHPQHHR